MTESFRLLFSNPKLRLFIFLVPACLIAFRFLIDGCLWWECAPKRSVSVYDFSLPDSFFPNDAEIHPLHQDRVSGSSQAAVATSYWKNGIAIYSVLRFASNKQAHVQYEHDAAYKPYTETTVAFAEITSYKSTEADEFVIDCGHVVKDFRCRYLVRYKEFVIFFVGSIGEDEIDPESFKNIIDYLDERSKVLLAD